jgi:methyl coenzyme M reductase subunit C
MLPPDIRGVQITIDCLVKIGMIEGGDMKQAIFLNHRESNLVGIAIVPSSVRSVNNSVFENIRMRRSHLGGRTIDLLVGVGLYNMQN